MTPPRLSAPGLQARAPLSHTAQGLLAASMLGAHLLAGWALLFAANVTGNATYRDAALRHARVLARLRRRRGVRVAVPGRGRCS